MLSMPPLETLLLFTVAAVMMNLSPGPSNFYVLSRSVAQGATAGILAALGLAAGSLVHVAAAAFGLSLVFEAAPLLYTALKILGAGYLIYLGLRTFFARAEPLTEPETIARTRARILGESVLVEVLNPKTALFFIALLPQFVGTGAPVAPQFLLLGLIVTVTAIPCDLAVAFGGGAAARWLSSNSGFQKLQNRVSGSILVMLGVYIAIDGARD
jgi:threonine/homoserine/homoserine lactone efflux protein